WYAYMEGYCETLPRYENTVSLSRDRRDRWGLPVLQVDMAYSDNERAMLKDVKETATEMLKAARCESVQGFEREPVPGEVIHEMGTARMGRDPKTSFLNGFNQCHESRNVFVTDGSCMPSTACQNPSFTYMALTARACRYAVEELKRGALLLLAFLLVAGPAPAQAQDRRGDVSLQVSVRSLHEFDETEAGFGARLSYRLTRWLAADGEVSLFPADVGSPAFSSSRLEGLAGVRGGPHLGRTGIFLALRAGAVRFSEAPEPFPCILIYPPPLVCALAGGDTIPTVQLTGGFEAYPRDRLVVRVEAGDQLLRYSGPAFTADREIIDKGLWSHNFKATAAVGLRF
ncbi:MAG TPA: GMC family oxidoreductase, partial [Vicinamibacteria bacterium]